MLVYLVQIADHCKVDLPQAVADKLVLNARKYPPAGVAVAPGAPPLSPLSIGKLGVAVTAGNPAGLESAP